MRRRSLLVLLALTAACGDAARPAASPAGSTTATTTTPTTTATLPARALTAPGSVADGQLVRYHEPRGEGPGFELGLYDDGSVRYERIDHDGTATATATHDVDELRDLLDGLEPPDVARGSADCRPEVDGSAPRLAVAAFEVDYCYTEPTDHPLVELVRLTRERLEAAATASATRFEPPDRFEGVLARYSMPGGECDRCDFTTTFRADGTVELRSSRGDRDDTYDAIALDELLDEFDPDRFALEETDCGREVDGNAPLLAVPDAEIDLCFWRFDPGDPLYEFVVLAHARVVAARDAASAGRAVVARVTQTGGLCPEGICTAVYEFRADGTWTLDAGTTTGTYDPVPLVVAATQHHVTSPILGPFTDTCPTAYDGTEIAYEVFDPTDGEIVLDTSSCTDRLDAEHPLLRAVSDAIAGASGG